MATPTFTLPTSGSDPKRATKESLEENINQIIQYLDNARISGDAALMAGLEFQGGWDASTGLFPDQDKDGNTITKGDFFWVAVEGTFGGETYSVNEPLVATVDNPSTSDWYHAPLNPALAPIIDRVDAMSVPFDTVNDFFSATLEDIKGSANKTTGVVYITTKDGNGNYTVDLEQLASGDGTNNEGVVFSLRWHILGCSVKACGALGDGITDDTDAFKMAAGVGTDIYIPPCENFYRLTDWVEMSGSGRTVRCSWASSKLVQETHGIPVFYCIDADISVLMGYGVCSAPRQNITGDMQTVFAGTSAAAEGTLAAFEFAAFVFVSGERNDSVDGFYMDQWYAESFATNGVFIRGKSTARADRINLGTGYAKDVDFGIKTGSIKSMNIERIVGEDITTVGSGEPEHVFYIIAGSSGDVDGVIKIGSALAKGVDNGRHAFQAKYVKNLAIGHLQTQGATGAVFNSIECSGYIQSYYAELDDSGVSALIVAQTSGTIRVGKGTIVGPFADQALVATAGATMYVDTPHIHHTGVTAHTNRMFFASSGGDLNLYRPKLSYETPVILSSTTSAFYATSANITVYDPEISGLPSGTANLFFGTSSGTMDITIDPQKIDQPFVSTTFNINTATGPYSDIKYLTETRTAVSGPNGSTPIVNHGTFMEVGNGSGTSITSFTRIPSDHKWTLKMTNSNQTYVHSSSLVLAGGVNAEPTNGDLIQFVERGGVVYETWRSF